MLWLRGLLHLSSECEPHEIQLFSLIFMRVFCGLKIFFHRLTQKTQTMSFLKGKFVAKSGGHLDQSDVLLSYKDLDATMAQNPKVTADYVTKDHQQITILFISSATNMSESALDFTVKTPYLQL